MENNENKVEQKPSFEIEEPLPVPEDQIRIRQVIWQLNEMAKRGEIITLSACIEQPSGDFIYLGSPWNHPFSMAGFMQYIISRKTLG